MLKEFKRIFFPDVSIQFLRSSLPSHQQLFRCPVYLTRRSIKEYLEKLYGLKVHNVRAIVKEKHVVDVSDPSSPYKFRLLRYKDAIVTLDENFTFSPKQPVSKDPILFEDKPKQLTIDNIDQYDERDLKRIRMYTLASIYQNRRNKPLIEPAKVKKKKKSSSKF